jgi:hypothetical protein
MHRGVPLHAFARRRANSPPENDSVLEALQESQPLLHLSFPSSNPSASAIIIAPRLILQAAEGAPFSLSVPPQLKGPASGRE